MPEVLQSAAFAAIIAVAALLAAGFLHRTIRSLAARGKIPAPTEAPLQRASRWGILAVALLLILSSYNISLGHIWTFVSALLAIFAIAFVAVWSMLSSFSATFLIFVVRPFNVGDHIEFVGEQTKGVVHSVGMMYTTLLDEDGHLVQVPNNIFFQKVLRRQRRFAPSPSAPLHSEPAERKGVDPEPL